MNKITRFFGFLLKLFLLASLLILVFNGIFLKPLLSSWLGLYWDTDVSTRRAQIDWALPGIIMEDVRVGNPYGFPRGAMLEIDSVLMRFDSKHGFLSQGALKPVLLEIQIRKIALMRRVSGHFNLELFVHPEQAPRRNRGLGLSPVQTQILVGEVVEMDATTPILKKQNYNFQNKKFEIDEKSNFRVLAQIFAKQVFLRIGFNEKGHAIGLPAPHYRGVAAAVKQEIREHVEKDANEAAADAEFEALAFSDEKKDKL